MKNKKIKNKKFTAIIVGSNGQDGIILNNKLTKLNYRIYKINKNNGNIKRPKFVTNLVKKIKPDEIYYLAAYHHSSEEKIKSTFNEKFFNETMQINVNAVIFFLEAITKFSPKTRFFYASSSLIFSPSKLKHNENTEINPSSYYGISKVAGMIACRYFREFKNVFASVGILYNHESSLRKKNFLSKKVVKAAYEIYRKKRRYLEIGNLNSKIDWGYADDYVDAMVKIIKLNKANDFIVASGKSYSVREFVKKTFDSFGLNYNKHIKINPKILKQDNYGTRIGDASRLRKLTGWKPMVNFNSMIQKLISDEKKLYEK